MKLIIYIDSVYVYLDFSILIFSQTQSTEGLSSALNLIMIHYANKAPNIIYSIQVSQTIQMSYQQIYQHKTNKRRNTRQSANIQKHSC